MKIGNFNISKKTIIIVAIVIGVIVLVSIISSAKSKQEEEERIAQAQAELQAALQQSSNGENTNTDYDYDSVLQQSLVEQYGEAPEGFIWDVTGNLVAVGTDELNAEQILYTYIRALSILDFSTAQKYSSHSFVTEAYKSYYSDITAGITDYYDNFLRQQFKSSLTTIEVLSVSDTAVFADGTKYVTVDVSVLDLSDKDFWLDDRDDLFDTMRVYDKTESDNVKLEKYLYEYIAGKYADGSVKKRTYSIEFVVEKQTGGGWLISNDKELYSILVYENGVDVAKHILSEFDKWTLETDLKEMQEQLQNNSNEDIDENYDVDSTEGI